MKIISLKSENVKCLKCVEITPDGNEIILTGSNGAGKSSVLDAIFYGLTGKKPKDPIRHGEEKSTIEIDLGKITVKRVFTRKGTRLEVMNEDGANFASPQALLDQILGELSFDPLAFQKMKNKDQRDLMVKLAGLNFAQSEARRAEFYANRTFQSRMLRDMEGQVKVMDAPGKDLPAEEVSISDCLDDLKELQDKDRAYDRAKADLSSMNQREQKLLNEIQGLKGQREIINQKLEDVAGHASQITQQIKGFVLPEKIDQGRIIDAEKMLNSIDGMNIKIREAARYHRAVGELTSKKKEVESITQKIDQIDQEKAEEIKGAVYPVKGLSVDDRAVLFNDIPFSQASTGQQIGISTKIAMSLNPKLKIILIRDGSLLDKEAFESISKAAKENDYQLWLERLDETGKVGFFIEDGEIVSVNGVSIEENLQEVAL